MNAFLWFLLPMIFFFWLDSSSKLRRMQGRVKSLEKYRKGEKTMSRFLKEMIGKKPMITSELIGTNDWLVVDVDEDWVKLSKTDKKGQPVNSIYIEETCQIEKELYLGAVIDRASQKVVFMASSAGGMSIEDVARETPELIHKVTIEPLVGGMPYQGRELAFKLGLSGEQNKQFAEIFVKLAQLFIEKDFSLVEVNPLVVTKEGNLICVDAKVGIDDNSLYRHPDLLALRDLSQSDAREAEAEKYQLNYVALEGDIGCMVNGAGLAMGTMDIVKLYGGNPANFLDVGGGATKERVAEAFKIILTDKNVKSVLVNIFGGIVRCDLIAEGVVAAIQEVGVKVPVVVRLEGTNAPQGRAILTESGVNLIAAHSLQEAAQAAVKAAKGE